MKCKIFEEELLYESGEQREENAETGDVMVLEDVINAWLKEHPNIVIVKALMSEGAAMSIPYKTIVLFYGGE